MSEEILKMYQGKDVDEIRAMNQERFNEVRTIDIPSLKIDLIPGAERLLVMPIFIHELEIINNVSVKGGKEKIYGQHPFIGMVVSANDRVQDRLPHKVGDLVYSRHELLTPSFRIQYNGLILAWMQVGEVLCIEEFNLTNTKNNG